MYSKQLLNQFLNQVVLIAIFNNWKSLVGLLIRLRAKSLASKLDQSQHARGGTSPIFPSPNRARALGVEPERASSFSKVGLEPTSSLCLMKIRYFHND